MISAEKLKIYCRFPVVRIADLEIEVKEGCHGRLVLRGFLSAMPEESPLEQETITITGQSSHESSNEEILFCGVIQETYIFVENGVRQIIISAATADIAMDKQKRSRSFQNVSESYGKIVQDAAAGYQGAAACEKSVKIGTPVLQYEETDWEFCKRMASYQGLGIFCNPCSPCPQLALGFIEEGERAEFPSNAYHVCINEDYYHKRGNGAQRAEFLYYQVESWENYGIGSSAYFQGQKRYIFEKRAVIQDGVLVFRYKLGGKCHFTKERLPNKKLAGLALSGTVERTEGQSVYLKLDIDGAKGKAAYAYPWAPATGNMMYCMPQSGTRAYLYFADRSEGSAAVVNSIRSGSSCPEFSDSQNRGVLTEHGKQMQLYADSLFFKGGKEGKEQKFSMEEAGCMFRAGAGKLVMTSGAGITLQAPAISIRTPQEINQYKMGSYASQKAGEIVPKGSGNPATGGDAGFSLQYEFNGMAGQGVLAGTEYERYLPFEDAPEYEVVPEEPLWLKKLAGAVVALFVGVVVGALVVATGGLAAAAIGVTALQLGVAAGAVTAGVGIAAVAATAAQDTQNGTESSLGDYISNAFKASAEVGGAIVALCLAPYGAEVLTAMTGITYLPVFGTVLNVGNIMMGLAVGAGSLNLGFQLDDVNMFVNGQKELGAPTGNPIYDTAKQTTEQASGMIAFMGLFNPRLYGDAKNNFKGSGNGETGIKERAGYQNQAVEGESGNYKEINIHGKINSEIDEVDLVNKIIYEDKSASKLYMSNPDFPQTEAQWAYKQIFKKGSNRINALQQANFTLSGADDLPDIEIIKKIKDYVFRIDADTPGLRAAVQTELNNLKAMFPDYNFSAIFGGNK